MRSGQKQASNAVYYLARVTSRKNHIHSLINDHDPSTLHCWPLFSHSTTIKRCVTKNSINSTTRSLVFQYFSFIATTLTNGSSNKQPKNLNQFTPRKKEQRQHTKIKIPTETFQFLTWKLMVWTLFFSGLWFGQAFFSSSCCCDDISGWWISWICKLINFIELLSSVWLLKRAFEELKKRIKCVIN